MSTEVERRPPADGGVPPPRRGRDRTAALAAAAGVVLLALVVAAIVVVRQRSSGDAAGGAGPTTAPAATTPPTGPLDVALVGDSFIEQTRDAFRTHLDADHERVDVSAFGGTALCDWRKQILADAARHPPILILSFAGNDVTPCMKRSATPSVPAQTAAEYEADYTAILPQIHAASPATRIFLVPPPPIRKPAFEANAAAMRAMYRRLAAAHPEVTLIDLTPSLGPDHGFHAALPCRSWEKDDCGSDGEIVLRQKDGIHLTPAGGERYARVLLSAIGAS